MTRNESLVGFLLEPVHSSTPPSLVELCDRDLWPRRSTGAYSLYSVGQPWLRDDFTPRA